MKLRKAGRGREREREIIMEIIMKNETREGERCSRGESVPKKKGCAAFFYVYCSVYNNFAILFLYIHVQR